MKKDLKLQKNLISIVYLAHLAQYSEGLMIVLSPDPISFKENNNEMGE